MFLLEDRSHFWLFVRIYSSFNLHLDFLSWAVLPWQLSVEKIVNTINEFLQIVLGRRKTDMSLSGCVSDITNQRRRPFGLRVISQPEVNQFNPVTVSTNHHILRLEVPVDVSGLMQRLHWRKHLVTNQSDGFDAEFFSVLLENLVYAFLELFHDQKGVGGKSFEAVDDWKLLGLCEIS